MGFDPGPAAAALHEARLRGLPAGPLPAGIAPRDLSEGAAVQLARAGLAGAVPPAGFKIGATAQKMRDYLGLDEPLAGFMPASALFGTVAVLRFADYRGVGVECEIAVRLAADLPAGAYGRAEAAAAVGEVFAAVEVVENRYGTPPMGDVAALGAPTLLADQVYHAAAVLGAPGEWRGLDLAALPGRMTVDGAEVGRGTGADLLGHPMDALAWLAGSPTVAAFGGLLAGQVVMLGSVTPPIWLAGPCRVRVDFTGLGVAEVVFG